VISFSGPGIENPMGKETFGCSLFLPNNSIIIMIRIMMMSLKRRRRSEKRLYKALFFCACRVDSASLPRTMNTS
jgi:hypothetical protein